MEEGRIRQRLTHGEVTTEKQAETGQNVIIITLLIQLIQQNFIEHIIHTDAMEERLMINK